MFTGIIETTGKITSVKKEGTNYVFTVTSPVSAKLKVDQSVAHDGVCLTVTQVKGKQHTVAAVKETLNRSALGSWRNGTVVNLERSMLADSRIDGHFVQGHVDTVTEILSVKNQNGSWVFTFRLPEKYRLLIVEKGSVTVNGISLTVSALKKNRFSVTVIPYTLEHTNLSGLVRRSKVNIEFDILGKYVLNALGKVI